MAALMKKEEIHYSIEAKKCLAEICREIGEKLARAGFIDLGSRYLKEAIDHAADVLRLTQQLKEEKENAINRIPDNTGHHLCDRRLSVQLHPESGRQDA